MASATSAGRVATSPCEGDLPQFGLAAEHAGGRCHLRLDDTNPDTEKAEFAEAMKRDIGWLGFDWG